MAREQLELVSAEKGQVAVGKAPEPGWRHPVVAYLAGLSSGESRRSQLSALRRVAGEDVMGFEWHRLRRGEVLGLRARLLEELSPATVSRILCAVRGVLKECWLSGTLSGEEYQKAAAVRGVKMKPSPAGRALSPIEQACLVEETRADSSTKGIRDAAIVAVLLSTGMRRAELVALNLKDYGQEDRSLQIQKGKGRKSRMTYLTPGAAGVLLRWIVVRGTWPGALFARVSKWETVSQHRISAQTVRLILGERSQAAGIPEASPHDLRRTFTSDLIDSGVDLHLVGELLGHSSPQTTKRYDRRGERAKAEAMGKFRVPGLD